MIVNVKIGKKERITDFWINDRKWTFGEDTKIVRTGKDRGVASIRVQISPVFRGWMFRFVGEMMIISPEQPREDYKRRAFDAVNM